MDSNTTKLIPMIIGINGYIGSGKDTVGKWIQYHIARSKLRNPDTLRIFDKQDISPLYDYGPVSGWEIRKFAGKLKQIASILTGIPVEKFEDQEFKKQPLGREWTYPTRVPGYGEQWVEMTVREFLQRLGTEAIRNGLHTNAWVNATMADYNPVYYQVGEFHKGPIESGDPIYPDWILTDCRFPNEAQAIKDHGGIVIRVNRAIQFNPREEYVPTTAKNHPSETSLDNWNFDYTIENHWSMEELSNQVRIMLIHFNLIPEGNNDNS